MSDAAMEKVGEKLSFWIHEMRIDKKSTVDIIVTKLEAREIYGRITQG